MEGGAVMEIKVFACFECSRVIQTLNDEKADKGDHRCPRHPAASLIYKGMIFYPILLAGPPGGSNG